jgi:hypothetical protein
LLTQILNETLDSRDISARNALQTAMPKALAAMCPKCLDRVFVNTHETQP